MEYIYGTVQRNGVMVENLKTVGAEHSELTDFIQTTREYPDQVITDSCKIVCKYRSSVDSEGNCYDWYEIDKHIRYVDKTGPIKETVEKIGTAASIAFVTMAENGTIDEVTAGEHTDLFAEWEPDVSYSVGSLRAYNGSLYRCIQAHTSQDDWTPDVSASLWAKAADPAEEWPEWSQPIGASDAYMDGDKVSHNDKHWKSTVDNNVWEPGVYGWEEA